MKFILHFSVLLLLGVLLSTCKEQIETDNTDKQFPLSLRAERQGDVVKFNWDPTNISNFSKFILVRSPSPLPTGLNPSFSTNQFEIIFQSNQQSTASFLDNSPPIIDTIYYKLYISLNNRFVESDNVVVGFNNFLTQGFATVVRFLPDSNWVLYTDEFNNRVNLVNYETQQLVKQVGAASMANSENMVVEFYEKDGKTRLYWWGNQGIQDFELPSLAQGSSYPETSLGFSLAPNTGGGNYIYSTQYDYTNSFTVRNKNTKAIVKGYYRSDYYNKRLIAVLDPVSNLILEVSVNRIMMYNVNPNTALLTNIKEKDLPSNFGIFSQLVVSPDRQHFIKDASGNIYNLNMEIDGQIPLQNPNFTFLIDASFAPDGQALYALINDQSQGAILLKKFSFPAMQLIGERKLSGVGMRGLRALDQGVVIIGNTNVNFSNSVLIKKYDL